jgi:hypothetical protein
MEETRHPTQHQQPPGWGGYKMMMIIITVTITIIAVIILI